MRSTCSDLKNIQPFDPERNFCASPSEAADQPEIQATQKKTYVVVALGLTRSTVRGASCVPKSPSSPAQLDSSKLFEL